MTRQTIHMSMNLKIHREFQWKQRKAKYASPLIHCQLISDIRADV